ncbi:MAG: NUDIX domain-containing protein [Candidatus Cybelea sp.]
MLAIFVDAPHGVVFVERAAHLRRHPSQIGLPGGIADPADNGDLNLTALRELEEEVGVERERVRVVGRLPERRQIVSRLLVTPIVALLAPHTPLRIDGTETAGVFTIPLESIVAAGAVHRDAERSTALGHTIYALDYDGRNVWGFTARILKSFAQAWNASDSPIRAAIESDARFLTEAP